MTYHIYIYRYIGTIFAISVVRKVPVDNDTLTTIGNGLAISMITFFTIFDTLITYILIPWYRVDVDTLITYILVLLYHVDVDTDDVDTYDVDTACCVKL